MISSLGAFAKEYNGKINQFKNTSCETAVSTLEIAFSSFEGGEVVFNYHCKAKGRDALAYVSVKPIGHKTGTAYLGAAAGFVEDGYQVSGQSAGQVRALELTQYVPSLISGGKVRMQLKYSQNVYSEQFMAAYLPKTQHVLTPEFILID